MKTTTAACSSSPALPLVRPRWLDFVEMTKPRIAVMVLFTVAVGALLAHRGAPEPVQLLHTLLGTALVACGASVLNQFLERRTDAHMRRTENRPLPAGRLSPLEVFAFGSALGAAGLIYLALSLRHPLAAVVAGVTFLSYVFVYTPLKRHTTLNTLVGAVPGALPPVIGWTAATGRLDVAAIGLFLIVFLWQVPHFLAIAWIYRDDYERAGLKMLPGADPTGGLTARQMVLYCAALIPVSLVPVWCGQAGWVYVVGAALLGAWFLWASFGFLRDRSPAQARRVLRASLVYLPALLALLVAETYWIAAS